MKKIREISKSDESQFRHCQGDFMRYIIGILLIAILIKPSVYACSIFHDDYESPIEIVKGIGGECYSKLIPPLKNYKDHDHGQTEFYLEEDDAEPIFTQKDRRLHDILCLKDVDGNGAIAYISQAHRYMGEGMLELNWLQFHINGEIIKSYTLLDIIEREDNFYDGSTCGPSFLKEGKGFILSTQDSSYVYQVVTLDGNVISFDPLTGERLSTVKPLHTLLMDGVRNNDLEQVRDVLQKGANPDKGNRLEGTPLHLAAELGHLEITKELLKAGAKLDFKHIEKYGCASGKCEEYVSWETEDSIPHHPLYVAVLNKHFGVVEALVNYGIDVNARGYYPNSPALEAAVRSKSTKLISYLVSKGANIDNTDALEMAIEKLSFEVVDLLINLGADTQQTKPLCVLAEVRGGNDGIIVQMARLLWEAGANINASSCWLETPLITTILEQDSLLAKFFIENGADVNSDGGRGWTPLYYSFAENNYSISENNYDLISLLVENNANITSITPDGFPALYYAIKSTDKDIVVLLLENGADPNGSIEINTENKYLTPPPLLFIANDEIKQLLLDYGVDINVTSFPTNSNALQYLIEKKPFNEESMQAMRFLLDAGIDTTHKNKYGQTAFDLIRMVEAQSYYSIHVTY